MNSYEYKRFMRDGSVKLTTAVVRSKRANAAPRKTARKKTAS